jgi:hypothetical protein
VTRPPIPSRDEVLAALAKLQADAQGTGRQPAVLALARQLGLANTTFRRNFPDITADLASQATARQRRVPADGGPPHAGCETQCWPCSVSFRSSGPA